MQAESDSIRFEVKIGSIVRAREVADGAEWTQARVEGFASWGLLLREVPGNGKADDGEQFAAVWSNIEIIPDLLRKDDPPKVTLSGEATAEARFSVKPGSVITAMAPCDGDRFAAEVLALTLHGPFVRVIDEGPQQGEVFGVPWKSCDLELERPEFTAVKGVGDGR